MAVHVSTTVAAGQSLQWWAAGGHTCMQKLTVNEPFLSSVQNWLSEKCRLQNELVKPVFMCVENLQKKYSTAQEDV